MLILEPLQIFLQVLRLDITPMVSASPTHSVSSAHLVLFSPATVDQLLVVTSSSEKEGGATLLKFSASNGQLLSQVLFCDKAHVKTYIQTISEIRRRIICLALRRSVTT